ncbi:MAG: apolipoprotein N-acyltransferase [Candidatus Omnitrophica bacterium]|nr:apolipoprotein N-acyltransferase [Candidatus Omnitrophota bacterium]MBU1996601.1 apolipoprotein N-acyltransferase [Candidatus Omnitrophota bacterium]MBU4334220.1 apolipoprotein N-acyltransferase [Candidatus Omnitrophota bacterium]
MQAEGHAHNGSFTAIKRKFIPFFLIFLSATLLALAFPKTDISFFVWIGLVPLMFVLDGKDLAGSFKAGYLCGILFFTGTVSWMIHVTVPGSIVMILYLGLYYAMFAVAYYYFSRSRSLLKLFLLPAVWVTLEYVKAYLIGGFDWASLGHAQYKNLALIQIAEFTGYYGVSYLIVAANVVIKDSLSFLSTKNTKISLKEILSEISILLVMILAFIGFGNSVLRRQDVQKKISVGIIQGNIDQELKWFEPAWEDILEKHVLLTKLVAKENPHLIVWPETSFPGFLILKDEQYQYSPNGVSFENNEQFYSRIKQLAVDIGIPILFGVVSEENGKFYNSAVLLSKEGKLIGKYNKLHLVPFGEYIPLRVIFPFLASIVPIEDFTSGNKFTVFSLPAKNNTEVLAKFSPLICFEDTVARLARRFIGEGAEFFVNITNDGWFKDTKAPFMHMQSSVFRSIENRKYLVRCTNTGVSNFIDDKGKILDVIKDDKGKSSYVTGVVVEDIYLNSKKTLYSKYGDLFAIFCIVFVLLGFGLEAKNFNRSV